MKHAHPFEPDTLRHDFPILAERVQSGKPLVYLDNGASTQRPRQVLDAMDEVYRHSYANVHRGIHWLSEQATEAYESARDTVARFLGAGESEQIVFTSGTTASINLVAHAWGAANLRPGDEILLTEMEHHSNIVPWQQVAETTGASIRWWPITDDGLLDLDVLDTLLTERTKIAAITHVSNVLGTINPIERIAEKLHAAGVLLLVDAAQSVPHMAVDVQSLGADFVAFSGHKMCGPTGVGVLWARPELLEAMPPFLGGGSMIRAVTKKGFIPAAAPLKFEAGTPPIVEAVGLAAAIDFLVPVGLDRIHDHEVRLAARACERLAELPRVRVLGPAPQQRSGIVSFVVEGANPHDVAQLLDQQGVAVRAGHHCTMPLHERLGIPASTRASFYLYNTLDEVDTFAEAMAGSLRLL